MTPVTTRKDSMRVLCVDDDVLVLSLVAETLGAQGHEVETALDGAHGLQKIATEERPYNLLIVDARMPKVDGWRFILEARAGGFNGKVIVFSAWLDEAERERYRRLDVDRLLDKPPKSGELAEAVKAIAASAV